MAEPAPWTPSTSFVLTGAEFDVVWEHLGLGATPVALRLPSPGRTLQERRRVVTAGVAGLRARGLAGPAGPDPALVRLLVLLARPDRHLEVRGRFGDGPLRAVTAERDGDGVLAVHTGGTVTVTAAGSPEFAAVSALPRRAPGPGPALRLPTAELARLLEGGSAADAGAEGEDPQWARPAWLVAGPAHRAQICAVRHDRWGSPARLPGYVTVVDTPRGRYRLTRGTGAHGGPEWSTLAPAGDGELRDRLAELFSPGRSAA
ncbi:ESX secretion-associated protein EspG [Pseudonocardia sp. ICBG1293]|uniref:ESX secretion-associated protein EspG n=1 Tax=Pseudonocardia sp. ICBG1293 TaxID=2844382 RepID=UPI001CCCFE75|nr:ESX secretion-associated protein EspG [Pseudonocardia sp. ICBG1293]